VWPGAGTGSWVPERGIPRSGDGRIAQSLGLLSGLGVLYLVSNSLDRKNGLVFTLIGVNISSDCPVRVAATQKKELPATFFFPFLHSWLILERNVVVVWPGKSSQVKSQSQRRPLNVERRTYPIRRSQREGGKIKKKRGSKRGWQPYRPLLKADHSPR